MIEPLADPADISPLLDEHHLVVLGDNPDDLGRFARRLSGHLAESVPGAAVIAIEGDRVRDLPTFCRQLSRALGLRKAIEPTIDAIVECLRSAPLGARHVFVLWHGADALLDEDVNLFGRVVNAMLGVAGELEHLSDDVLVLMRVVFLGNDKLGAYAEDDRGQFRSWRVREDATTRFWDVASCIERPPVLTYRLNG